MDKFGAACQGPAPGSKCLKFTFHSRTFFLFQPTYSFGRVRRRRVNIGRKWGHSERHHLSIRSKQV